MDLHAKDVRFGGFSAQREPFLALVTTNPQLPRIIAQHRVLKVRRIGDVTSEQLGRFRAILTTDGSFSDEGPSVGLPGDFEYLDCGDVIRVNPAKLDLRVIYRRGSQHNSLLLTERCNSFCVMCSQPPRAIDDSYLVGEACRAIELMDRGTEYLGLTGGEPTLLGRDFLRIVRHARNFLPNAKLHVLTNGRLFADLGFARQLAEINHPNLVLGIPLYSDQPDRHDFVVQSKNAFDETIKGIRNLKAYGVAIELRVVIHRQTYSGLPDLARFIARNLAFVDCVALMGLEAVGFAKSNIEALWIDPFDYRRELSDSVRTLERTKIPVWVFNHQHCVVNADVRKNCVKSISDWKNAYLEVCDECSVKEACGGFFTTGTSLENISAHVAPI